MSNRSLISFVREINWNELFHENICSIRKFYIVTFGLWFIFKNFNNFLLCLLNKLAQHRPLKTESKATVFLTHSVEIIDDTTVQILLPYKKIEGRSVHLLSIICRRKNVTSYASDIDLIVFVFPYRRCPMTAHYERNWPYSQTNQSSSFFTVKVFT